MRKATRVIKRLSELGKDPSSGDDAKERMTKLKQTSNPIVKNVLGEHAPIFFERKEDSQTEFHLEPDFEHLRTDRKILRLLKNPTDYIEKTLNTIARPETKRKTKENPAGEGLPKGKNLYEYIDIPYDISKVKIMKLDSIRIVVKRSSEFNSTTNPLEEYRMAIKAMEAGILTPKPIGYIIDKGNTYLLFEYLEDTCDLSSLTYFEAYKKHNGIDYRFCDLEGVHGTSFDNMHLEDSNIAEFEEYKFKENISDIIHIILSGTLYLYHENENAKTQTLNTESESFLADCDRMYQYFQKALNKTHVNDKRLISLLISEYLDIDISPILLSSNYPKEILINILIECCRKIDRIYESVAIADSESRNSKIKLAKKVIPPLECEVLGASFTFPYQDFLNQIMISMSKNGIRHQDLARRNILVSFDKKNKRFIPDENGNAQFYIIDWEQDKITVPLENEVFNTDDNKPRERTIIPNSKIGFSLSRCVKDIMFGKIKEEEVKEIIAGTSVATSKEFDELMEEYKIYAWNGDIDKGEAIARRLYESGKIKQPRLEGKNPPDIGNGYWKKAS